MRTEDFNFDLPVELIAQHPTQNREECKLMILDKNTGKLEHKYFYNIIDYLNPNDVLVINDTKVIPARIYGHRPEKDEKIEVLILNKKDNGDRECLVKPGKKMKIGQEIVFSSELSAKVIDITEDGQRILKFFYDGIFEEILDKIGFMPLPPYITEPLKNKDDYQTVYAQVNGSAAAPTAGLHFTEDLLNKISEKGVDIAKITLHVGLGTFRPVSVENIKDHKMHEEVYFVDEEAASKINKAIENGGRVITVGTTSTRTLESVYKKYGKICADSDSTSIFIYPGYKWGIVDAIITNFHLPKSTLIMMMSSFAGRENILNAYKEAVNNKYRFFSFGDAMFITDNKR